MQKKALSVELQRRIIDLMLDISALANGDVPPDDEKLTAVKNNANEVIAIVSTLPNSFDLGTITPMLTEIGKALVKLCWKDITGLDQ